MWSYVLLLFYVILNALGICGIASVATDETDTEYSYLVYPVINTNLELNNINWLGKTILFILYTLLFGPATLIWYVTCLLMFIMKSSVKLFIKIFQKRG